MTIIIFRLKYCIVLYSRPAALKMFSRWVGRSLQQKFYVFLSCPQRINYSSKRLNQTVSDPSMKPRTSVVTESVPRDLKEQKLASPLNVVRTTLVRHRSGVASLQRRLWMLVRHGGWRCSLGCSNTSLKIELWGDSWNVSLQASGTVSVGWFQCQELWFYWLILLPGNFSISW